MKRSQIMMAALAVISAMQMTTAQAAPNNPEVDTGKVGYIYKDPTFPWVRSGYVTTLKGPGNYGWSPYSLAVIQIDIQPQTFDETFEIVDVNQLKINFQVHAILRPDENKIKDVVEHYGSIEWYKRVVQAPFRTFVREAVGAVNSQSMSLDQNQIQKTITDALKSYLSDKPFIVDNVSVGNFSFPSEVSDAAAKKLAANQILQTKSTQLEVAGKDAEIEVAKAKGIRAAQDIINSTLTDIYVKHEMVESLKDIANKPGNVIIYIPMDKNGLPVVTSPDQALRTRRVTGGTDAPQ